MTKKLMKKISYVLTVMLFAAMAITLTGCKDKPTAPQSEVQETTQSEFTTVGNGSKEFKLIVTDGEGNVSKFLVKTDSDFVGEALYNAKLIDGDFGEYGLYIKTVNGITADYETSGTYWAFYIDGEYATSSADSTSLTEGATYEFKVEK